MKLERLLGLLAMTGITLLALFLFFPSRHSDDISTVDSSTKTDLEQPILSVTKDFKILSESNFDFYVYRAHVLSSKENADKLVERVLNSGFPSFVESFGENGDLFAIYVGPFLSKDDIVNNMDLIQVVSESSNGEISRWKL